MKKYDVYEAFDASGKVIGYYPADLAHIKGILTDLREVINKMKEEIHLMRIELSHLKRGDF